MQFHNAMSDYYNIQLLNKLKPVDLIGYLIDLLRILAPGCPFAHVMHPDISSATYNI
jgi:hypothetical protein